MRSSSNHPSEPPPAAQASLTNAPVQPPAPAVPPQGHTTPSSPLEALASVAAQILKQADVQTMRMTQMTAEEEAVIGATHHRLKMQTFRPANNDPRNDFVQKILDRLDRHRTAPGAKLKLMLLDSGESNAYAGLGGYMYITTAFLDRFPGEALIAMVLAHEIGHVDLLHVRRKVQIAHQGGKILGSLGGDAVYLGSLGADAMQTIYNQISTPYQREEEFQADRFGFDMARRAGWQKEELLELLREMVKVEAERRGPANRARSPIDLGLEAMLSTHPNFTERLARLEAQ